MTEEERDCQELDYVSLHNHTTFSILDSLIKPIQLFETAKLLGQTAVAVTDHGTMAGMWDSLKASRSTGVKMIAGCELYFVDDVADADARMRHIVLLAKNETGYRNLLEMEAAGYDNYSVVFRRVFPRIDWNILKKYSEGLICTTACANGILGQLLNSKLDDEAEDQADRLQQIFGDDLAIEIQPHALKRKNTSYSGEVDQTATNRKLRIIAEKLNIKCIVANDAHYVTPDQHRAHDVLLAIASGQPVSSGARLKYDMATMHIKSAEEVYNKLARLPSQRDFARQCIENTKYFADKCEFPEWIDPKFSNPSGKELPEFPVKDQKDYHDFKKWEETNPFYAKDEDEVYLRYRCDLGLKRKIHPDNQAEYQARLEEEFDVIEYHKFSSYMLIVMDYIEWANDNNIPVGPGRGCLTESTRVLTTKGFKYLPEVDIGDYVFTHTGDRQEVLNKFSYDVDENGIEIGTNFSFGAIQMTSDHKVYACKAKETPQYVRLQKTGSPSINKLRRWKKFAEPSWISAKDLLVNDAIFMPFPQRVSYQPKKIDLWKCLDKNTYSLRCYTKTTNFINRTIPKDNQCSVRAISSGTGLTRNVIKGALRGKSKEKTNKIITKYLQQFDITLDAWQKSDNTRIATFARYIDFSADFCYFLGRWAGDGWIMHCQSGTYLTGMAFHKDDEKGIKWTQEFLESFGFAVYRQDAKNQKLVQLIVREKLLFCLLRKLFPDYHQTSQSKHFPEGFGAWDTELLFSLVNGLIDSDGSVEHGKRHLVRENIDTTSVRLAEEIKEALLYLKIPSSIYTRKPYDISCGDKKYRCSQSYKIRFKGIKTLRSRKVDNTNGYWCKISSLKSCPLKRVYDISVSSDHSYVTSNYAVHNSVGGSLIGYLTDIHMVDPIKYGLIFARFHNKEKTSFPDIDTDFAPTGRPLVQDYIRQKYGEHHVAHVSNVNTMTPKVYARAIARAFVYGGDRKTAVQVGTAIADAIPNEVKTVPRALEKAALFAEYAKPLSEGGGGYTELKDFAADLGGKAVAWSTHAGGVVIGRRPLRGLIPIRRDKEGNVAIEYEKERAEANGLVKMDTLGLETLDIIAETYKLIDECGKPAPPKYPDFEEYDEKTYNLIGDGDTFCVFQLGTSSGTIDLCRKVKPKNIEDIAIVNSLARPSARDIRADYITTRNGEMPVHIMHSSLERAFLPTLGFGLYEECLLYLAQDVAGWSLHEADRLRKLTKEKGKNPEKVKKWKKEFIEDAVKNGIDKKIAKSIWEDVIGKFSGYGFNKSHAVFYSLIGYHTAWLKAHYPLEFLVANLRSEVNSNARVAKDNIAKIKEEIRRLNVKIVPPNINKSETTYKIIDEKTLMTGFDALKYIGKDAIPEILAKRPFTDFEDFLTKVDGRKVRAPAIQALAASGCLDSFGMSRRLMFLYAMDYKKKLGSFLKRKTKKDDEEFKYPWPKEDEWTVSERCALERYYLGESLSGDKVQAFSTPKEGRFFTYGAKEFKYLPKLHPPPPSTMTEKEQRKYTKHITRVQAEVKNMFEFKVKKEDSKIKGEVMAKVTLEDPHGNQMTMTCFPDSWVKLQNRCLELSNNKHKLDIGVGLYLNGELNWYEGDLSLIYGDLTRFSPPPQLPEDLKAKKVTMRRPKKSKSINDEDDRNILLDELEEELIETGNSDLDDEDDDEYNFG